LIRAEALWDSTKDHDLFDRYQAYFNLQAFQLLNVLYQTLSCCRRMAGSADVALLGEIGTP
jgi:hypothetical protein